MRLLCKIGIHHNVFSKEYYQQIHRMNRIYDDLDPAFEKHFDSPSNSTYMKFDECKHCGRVKIVIHGKVKQS